MPVSVKCTCGASYSLKDEYAGKSLKCPQCGATVTASAAAPPAGTAPDAVSADPVFGRDKFLLAQKHFSINEKYVVNDEAGRPIIFVERPTHLFRQLLALGGVIVAVVVWWMVIGGLVTAVGGEEGESPLAGLLSLLGFFGMIPIIVLVAAALSPKRHVSFYTDESMSNKVLEVLQDHKLQIIYATYTVRDNVGRTLATFRKSFLFDIFRKKWECTGPSGQPLFEAREDSILLSLLRRVLGPFFGLLRTNFVFERGDQILGEFNRKLTILDHYVLDMTRDTRRSIDRRIALAMGVMLDTGERR